MMSKLSTRYGLVGIGALALLSVVHWMRGHSLDWPPLINFSMGVLPNIAAAIAIPFVFMSIFADQKKDADVSIIRRAHYVSVAVSCLGLLTWELIQRTSNRLVFDVNDLAATVIGSIFALVVFSALTPKK